LALSLGSELNNFLRLLAVLLLMPPQLNHGLEITPDGKTIFVSSIASVFAYDYDAAAGTVWTKKAVITDMSIPGPYHLTRTLRIPKSDPNILIVQRG
jgi:hypothetical protein